MIPRDVIEEILRRSDVVRVVGSYVNLKSAGSNFTGLCPFHNEKTPSFTVFPKSSSFYCFGCGAGGDVITFIEKAENLDYPDAVAFLAARAGIEIPEDKSAAPRGPGRDRIRQMNKEAAKIFHKCLLDSPEAGGARAYLRSRGIASATVRGFYLGYSPDSPGWLFPQLKKLGFTEEEMTAGFLCGSSGGRIYDYFRGRVIFPIADTSGNVVAFGGRVMTDRQPKYLNTSDTPAFRKSRTLFALNYAKDYCSDAMIMCEGYMDVIAMHQAGFRNAVATLGTAVTEEHARVLAKYTKKVILAYDSDGAGQNATKKAIGILSTVGIDVRILKIEGAKDPDEFIRKFGPEKFRRLIEGSSTGFEYRLGVILSGYDLTLTPDRLKAAEAIASEIARYGSAVERELYISEASKKLGVTPEALRSDVDRQRRKKIRAEDGEMSKEASDSAKHYNDKVNPDAASNVRAASAEETIIGLLLIYPEYRDAAAKGTLAEEDFVTGFSRRVFSAIMKLHNSDGGFLYSLLGEEFSPDEMSRLQRLEQNRRRLTENGRDVFDSAVAVLKEEKEKKDRKESGTPGGVLEAIEKTRRQLEEEKRKRASGKNNG